MRERLLASSMICGAAFAALAVTPAFAADETEVQEIVVTGSRIPTPNLTSVSPVTAIGAADIKAQGVTRVEDMLNSLPQTFAGQGSGYSNGATGTATVNLRGLGASRTLVLIDGRRLGPGNPTSTGDPAADLNFIPASMVERVDVLTGGASAVYGADAVAGVVNFIMKKDFEGVSINAQWSTYQHNQHDDSLQSIIKAKAKTAKDPSQFKLPKDNVRDGDGAEVTLTMGVNSPDGKGNITAYASYRSINKVMQGDRDYSVCTLNSGNAFTCGGSGTASPARFGSFVVEGNTFRPRVAATDVYNFGPTNYYQRPDERYMLGAFAHYQVADWAEVYSQVMFMDDRSVAQIAPGGIFFGDGASLTEAGFDINCDNPLMTATQQGQLCGANAGTTAVQRVLVARRNVEGGGRQSDLRHQAYRYVVGVNGALSDNWTYDAYMAYSSTKYDSSAQNYFMKPRIANALQVRIDPKTGQPACVAAINGTDKSCAPYNIFQEGKVTQAALNYLQVPAYTFGNTSERVVSLNVGGDLTPYGIKTPWADEGVGVALGAEYRRENMDVASDYLSQAGLASGSGGASPPINNGFDLYEIFGEARVPIAQDKPFIKSLQAEFAYRYSDYSYGKSTNTYKAGGDWEPIDGLRLRAAYQRSVRAPNIVELYGPQTVQLDGTTDPCAGLKAGDAKVAQCAKAFNLTTAQVLAIEPNPAAQYYGQQGGNPNLNPEKSDTVTVGFVAQPSFLPGSNFSVDWFDIKVEDYISGIGADTIVKSCVDTLDPYFCGLVKRDPTNGSIWISQNGYVVNTKLNTGSLQTRGVDVAANYRFNLDDVGLAGMGSVNASFTGTWLDKLVTQSLPGGKKVDCAGVFGSICLGLGGSNTPNPEWRHKFRVEWVTPFPGDLKLSAQWRYFSKVDHEDPANAPKTDAKLDARSYLDLLATFNVMDNYSFRVGVNNVLDKDPPLTGQSNCPSGTCNGNTFAQMYDALGRYFFVGLTADF